MARSLYKGERLGNRPPCLLCVGAGTGERLQLHLGHGVAVWLCEAHRDPAFLRRRAGRDLVAGIGAVWSAAGCLTARRARALAAYRERTVREAAAARSRPGSYAWPDLRREAQRLLAAGEPPQRIIRALRARAGRGEARAPSVRTMQRWLTQPPDYAPADPRSPPPPASRSPSRATLRRSKSSEPSGSARNASTISLPIGGLVRRSESASTLAWL